MKTRIASLLVLAATLSTFAFATVASAAANSTPSGFSVGVILQADHTEIARGTSQMTVRRLMGPAQRELSPNVWIYSGFHPNAVAAGSENCNNLIVTFASGKVSDLKIVNESAVQVIAANLKSPASTNVQVARK